MSSITPLRQPPRISSRDKTYLDKYYDADLPFAQKYGVDPALILGVGIESGFASRGTYLRTGDAFGRTGGSTKDMTTARSPAEDVGEFFREYGNQIRGSGGDVSVFLYGLEGRDRHGNRVPGWKTYNVVNKNWPHLIQGGISEMQRQIALYRPERGKSR